MPQVFAIVVGFPGDISPVHEKADNFQYLRARLCPTSVQPGHPTATEKYWFAGEQLPP